MSGPASILERSPEPSSSLLTHPSRAGLQCMKLQHITIPLPQGHVPEGRRRPKLAIRGVPLTCLNTESRRHMHMAQAETFSTAGVEPRRKLEFWNALASNSFSPSSCELRDPLTFSGW